MTTHRMDGYDALLWAIEGHPLLGSGIVGVVLLDGAPDHSALEQRVTEMSHGIVQLRSTAAARPHPLAPARWHQRDDVETAHHISRGSAQSRPGELTAHVATLSDEPYVAGAPLWHLHILTDLPDGRTALLARLHHSITDGMGAMTMAASFFDADPDGTRLAPTPTPPPTRTQQAAGRTRTLASALAEDITAGTSLARGLLSSLPQTLSAAVRHPQQHSRDTAALASSFLRLTAPATRPLSPALTGRSGRSTVTHLDVPLEGLRRSAHAAHGRINDAYLTGVLRGLQRYHTAGGHPLDALRMSMPVNYRHADDTRSGGNHFTPVRLTVPTTQHHPAALLCEVREHLHRARSEPALRATPLVAEALARLPVRLTQAAIASMFTTTDISASNLPGPPMPLWCAGRRVEAIYAAPPLGGTAVSSALISYQGTAHIMVNMDTTAVTEPDLLADCLRDGFDEVLNLTDTTQHTSRP